MTAAVPLSSISPILVSGHFLKNVAINALVTIAINVFIDMKIREGMLADPLKVGDAFAIVTQSTMGEVLFFVAIVSLVTYYSSGSLVQRLKNGDGHPVRQSVLARSAFFRVVGGVGERRVLPFFVCCLVFPGTLLAALLVGGCWGLNGLTSEGEIRCVAPSLSVALLWVALWKGLCATAIYTLNYVACHNDSQPALLKQQ